MQRQISKCLNFVFVEDINGSFISIVLYVSGHTTEMVSEMQCRAPSKRPCLLSTARPQGRNLSCACLRYLSCCEDSAGHSFSEVGRCRDILRAPSRLLRFEFSDFVQVRCFLRCAFQLLRRSCLASCTLIGRRIGNRRLHGGSN